MTTKTETPSIPPSLESVALIDAPVCAAAGGMSVSWWLAEVAAGRAPKPVIRKPRCTRWRLNDVKDFWVAQVEGGMDSAERVTSVASKASAAARAKREGVKPGISTSRAGVRSSSGGAE